MLHITVHAIRMSSAVHRRLTTIINMIMLWMLMLITWRIPMVHYGGTRVVAVVFLPSHLVILSCMRHWRCLSRDRVLVLLWWLLIRLERVTRSTEVAWMVRVFVNGVSGDTINIRSVIGIFIGRHPSKRLRLSNCDSYTRRHV